MALFKKKQPSVMKQNEKKKRSEERKQKRDNVKAIVGRVVLVVFALIVCAIPAVFVNNVIGYLPLIALVTLLILSFVYLQILKRSFSFSEDSLLPSCERGSNIDFVIKLKNASPLVFLRLDVYIYISDLFDGVDTITPVSMTLMPFEKRDFCFQAKFDHIGTYSAGVRKVVINDLLGLFTHTIVNEKRHRVEVLPCLFDIENIPMSSEVSSESAKPRQALTVDDMDYAGVREYEWGDPIKTIHWKLSARNPTGQYLTRLFETYSNPGVAIIFDTSSPKYDTESLMSVFDGIVESGLSVNQFAVSQGVDAELIFKNKYGENAKLRLRNVQEFAELTSILPRIKVGNGDEALELLRREGNSLHGQDNIAFCTSQVTEEIVTTLVSIKMRKRNPILLLTVPPAMTSEEVRQFTKPLRRLDEARIPRYVLTSASDLGVESEG